MSNAVTIEELEKQKADAQAQIKSLVESVESIEAEIERKKREKKLSYPISSMLGKTFGFKSKEYKQGYALERWAREHGYVEYKPLKNERKKASDQLEMTIEEAEGAENG